MNPALVYPSLVDPLSTYFETSDAARAHRLEALRHRDAGDWREAWSAMFRFATLRAESRLMLNCNEPETDDGFGNSCCFEAARITDPDRYETSSWSNLA